MRCFKNYLRKLIFIGQLLQVSNPWIIATFSHNLPIDPNLCHQVRRKLPTPLEALLFFIKHNSSFNRHTLSTKILENIKINGRKQLIFTKCNKLYVFQEQKCFCIHKAMQLSGGHVYKEYWGNIKVSIAGGFLTCLYKYWTRISTTGIFTIHQKSKLETDLLNNFPT